MGRSFFPSTLSPVQALGRLEHQIDMYSVEGKLDLPVRVPSRHARGKQSVHVTMNRLYVPPRATRRLAQGQRPPPVSGNEVIEIQAKALVA